MSTLYITIDIDNVEEGFDITGDPVALGKHLAQLLEENTIFQRAVAVALVKYNGLKGNLSDAQERMFIRLADEEPAEILEQVV